MIKDFDENESVEGSAYDEALDEALLSLGTILREEDAKTAVLNLPKMKLLEGLYQMADKMFKNTPVRVSYLLHKPYQTMGSVTLEGPDVMFVDAKWLTRFAQLASNMEAYPLTNGRVRMTFTFIGLTKPIREV